MFESVHELQTIHVLDEDMYDGRQDIVLCHYPLEAWDGDTRGNWMLHGHLHGSNHHNKVRDLLPRIDVGVDCFDYQPVSYNYIKSILTKRFLKNE
jgi:calcineurin-like phosphoesterase family protein